LNVDLVLHVIALVCFILAGLGVGLQNGIAWGLAFYILSLLI